MAPTSVITAQPQQQQMESCPQYPVKDQFASKRLVVCFDSDMAIIQNVISAFNEFLSLFPEWNNQTALIFLTHEPVTLDHQQRSNIYFYNSSCLDKETRNTLAASAAVKIALDDKTLASADPHILQDETTPMLISSFHTCSSSPSSPSLSPKQRNRIMVNILNYVAVAQVLNNVLTTQPLSTATLLSAYKFAKNRLFLFDYDGTLTPIVRNPEDAQPTPTLIHYLTELCKDASNTVWIISGRDQEFLDTWLGDIPRLGLSAEHGSFMKQAGLNDWVDMLKDADMSWKDIALQIFQKYTTENPGTVIEQKKSSITWHYRNALDTVEAEKQSKSCHAELLKIPGVDILVGKMNLEVRSLLVNKGEVVKRIKQQQPSIDFVMCAGDDQTDEDMFNVLKEDEQTFSISVGPLSKITMAKYCVEHSEDIVNIIGQLVSNQSAL